MSPAPYLTFPASPAFLRRLVVLLLSSTLVLFLAGSALAAIDTPRPITADAFSSSAWEPTELPDVAVTLTNVSANDPALERLAIPALREINGVSAVVGEIADSGRVALYVSLTPDASDRVLPAIERTLEETFPQAQVSMGGRAVADRDLLDRLNRGTIVAVVPVVVLLTILIAASLGLRAGLAAGGTVGLSSLLGGLVGSRVAGSFDGSLGTTAVPAVLVAVLVSSVLTFRLLNWFKTPRDEEPADAIRTAVAHLLPEAGLLFGGLIASAVMLELAGSARTPAGVVAVGGLFAGLVTFGTLPFLLATQGPLPDEDDYKLFKFNMPDGRDLPLAALAGLTCFLLCLGLFAIRVPSSELLDESALAPGVTSRRVSEQLTELGGDPTSSILAAIPASVDDQAVADWSRTTSALATVGWIETSTGRYAAGSLVSAPASSANFVTDDATLAIITPTVTPRSTAAQDLVAQLPETAPSFDLELSGVAVDARDVSQQGISHLWVLVLLLSVAGGLAVLLLVNDLMMAILSFGLRLVGTAALLGVYYLVSSDVGGVDLQIAALIFSVGVGLFEIGFLRRIRNDVAAAMDSVEVRTDVVSAAFRREGGAAMLGLGVTALCGLGFVANDLGNARQLGLAVAAGVVIELLIGTWLLRPAVLGERALGVALGGSLLDRRAFNGDRPPRELFPAATSQGKRDQPGQTQIDADTETVPLSTRIAAGLRHLREIAIPEMPIYSQPPPPLVSDAVPIELQPEPFVSPWTRMIERRAERRRGIEVRPVSRAGVDDDIVTKINPDADALPMIVPLGEPQRSGLFDDPVPSGRIPLISKKPTNTTPERQAEVPRIRFTSTEDVSSDDLLAEDLSTADVAIPASEEVETTAPAAVETDDPGWRRIVSGLLRSEFDFQKTPGKAQFETVFVEGTPLFSELLEHNKRLRRAGLRVDGRGPVLRKLTAVNQESPVTVVVTVDHPPRHLLDAHDRVLGTRPAERRDGMLWLVQDPSGRYRIAEAVDLGTTEVTRDEGAGSAPAPSGERQKSVGGTGLFSAT